MMAVTRSSNFRLFFVRRRSGEEKKLSMAMISDPFPDFVPFLSAVAEDTGGQQYQKLITTLKAGFSSITVHPHILSSFFTF